jgi:hypothetical protein
MNRFAMLLTSRPIERMMRRRERGTGERVLRVVVLFVDVIGFAVLDG